MLHLTKSFDICLDILFGDSCLLNNFLGKFMVDFEFWGVAVDSSILYAEFVG
jgi:hypothetical protein